jgi:hypothetical protein
MGPPQRNATGLLHFERNDVTHDVFFPCIGFRVWSLGFSLSNPITQCISKDMMVFPCVGFRV